MKNNWEVIVGNIGTVYRGTNGFTAVKEYHQYVALSRDNYGRCGNEQVILLKNDNEFKTYFPRVTSDNEEKKP